MEVTKDLRLTESLVSGFLSQKVRLENSVLSGLPEIPYFGMFKKQTTLESINEYTADVDCFMYVTTSTDGRAFQTIITLLNNIYIRQYQNPTSQADIEEGFIVAMRAGDTIRTIGTDVKRIRYIVYKR